MARAREATLAGALGQLRDEVGQLNTDQVTLRALEREAEASRTLLETFLTRSKETVNQEDFQEADATLVSRADVPERPSHPRKKLLLVASVAVAALMGLMLALGIEMLDHGFRSMEQIEQQLGAPPLGLIPTIRGLDRMQDEPRCPHPGKTLVSLCRIGPQPLHRASCCPPGSGRPRRCW